MSRLASGLLVVSLCWFAAGCVDHRGPAFNASALSSSPNLLFARPQGLFLSASPVSFSQHHDGSIHVQSAAGRVVPLPVSSFGFVDHDATLINESVLPFLVPSCQVAPPASLTR